MTLWSQQGSDVLRGDLLVIPIEESILYIEPVYLIATDKSNLPELKQVIAAYGEKIAMKETLAGALEEIFGREAALVSCAPAEVLIQPQLMDQSIIELAKKITFYFQASTESFRKGDWAGYGQYQEQLQKVIQDLSRALEQDEKAKNVLTHYQDHNRDAQLFREGND